MVISGKSAIAMTTVIGWFSGLPADKGLMDTGTLLQMYLLTTHGVSVKCLQGATIKLNLKP